MTLLLTLVLVAIAEFILKFSQLKDKIERTSYQPGLNKSEKGEIY